MAVGASQDHPNGAVNIGLECPHRMRVVFARKDLADHYAWPNVE